MGYYEKRINDEVAYWVDEWELDDYNVFKLDLDEDFDIQHVKVVNNKYCLFRKPLLQYRCFPRILTAL